MRDPWIVRGLCTLGAGVLTLSLTACAGSAVPVADKPVSPVPPSTSIGLPATTPPPPSATPTGAPRPVACTTVTDQGGLAASGSGTQVSLDQISKAVGFTVTTAMPDTQSALGSFNGYENCRYQFTTPSGGAQVDVTLVVGTSPLDGRGAAAEYAETQSVREPINDRSCSGNGCGYTFSPLSGLGDSAIHGVEAGSDDVVVALQGRVYLEIGPGDLREERMVNLARLILGAVH